MFKTSIFFTISTAHLFDRNLTVDLGYHVVVGWGRSPKAAHQDAERKLAQLFAGRFVILSMKLCRTREAHTGKLVWEGLEGDFWHVTEWQAGTLKGLEKIIREMGI